MQRVHLHRWSVGGPHVLYGACAMRYPTDMSSIRHLTIHTYAVGDPRGQFLNPSGEIVRRGEPLSFFRQRLGGDAGFLTWRYGDTYWVSLEPWEHVDPETTYLHYVFHRSYDRTALERSIGESRMPHPCSRSGSFYVVMDWQGVFAMRCSDVGFDHEVWLYPGLPTTTTTTEELLMCREASAQHIVCPVCDTIIPLKEPVVARIHEMIIEMGSASAPLQLVITHPLDLPETKAVTAPTPFVVEYYHRYFPVDNPTLNTERFDGIQGA